MVKWAGARAKREFSSNPGRDAGERESLDNPLLGGGSGFQQKKVQGFNNPVRHIWSVNRAGGRFRHRTRAAT